jgi:threonine dehydratase
MTSSSQATNTVEAAAGHEIPDIGAASIARAHRESTGTVKQTPIVSSASLSDRCGGEVVLKAENLQRTGSFKLRGALNKIRTVAGQTPGVVAGSAGNHAQSLAYAARAHGVRCEVFMPENAAISKIAAVQAFGATVHRRGNSVDDCVLAARDLAADTGLTFVHPFDDLDVITGQAGVGLEILESVPTAHTVIVPVGGGGLAAGVAIAIKQHRPQVRLIGVQATGCAPYPRALETGQRITIDAPSTIADGIAVKQPGSITLPLISHWLDDVVTVDDDAIAEAMVFLVERAKLVVEGAGATSVAALLAGAVTPGTDGSTVAVLSGGNIDVGLLAGIASRHETRAGRRSRLFTRVSDRPGGLAALLAAVAETKANVLALEHVRDGVNLDVRQTGVELTLETSGPEHIQLVIAELEQHGYQIAAGG